MAFFVYIIYNQPNDIYYIGQTANFKNRLARHNNGMSPYTSRYHPWTAKCIITKETRGEAMILERKLKNLNRQKLLKFIKKYGLNE